MVKRIRSSPEDAEGFNTLKAFCKGDQRDLADSGQQNDKTFYGETSLILLVTVTFEIQQREHTNK